MRIQHRRMYRKQAIFRHFFFKIAVFVSILTSPDELLCGKNFAIEEICETKEKSVAEILIQKGGLTAIWVLKDVLVIFF